MTDPRSLADDGFPDGALPEDEALAAEYVLGVLPAADHAALEGRVARDPAFAAQVARWSERLVPLADGPAVTPPADLLAQVEGRLFAAPRPAGRLPRRVVWWIAGGLAAAAIAAAVVPLVPRLLPQPETVAQLSAPAGDLRFSAGYDGGVLVVSRVAGAAAPAGRSYQLWQIAPGGAPVPLGLIGDAALHVTMPKPARGWTLAVSLEPAGGSPSGLPTGPVIASGLAG